jgi:hypothetical protein
MDCLSADTPFFLLLGSKSKLFTDCSRKRGPAGEELQQFDVSPHRIGTHL